MGDRHRWRFKFLGRVDSLLRVRYSAHIHDGMVGHDDLAVVADVHGGTLAGSVAFTLQAHNMHVSFVPLLRGFDRVSLNHFTDGLVPGGLEALDQLRVSVGIDDRTGSGFGPRSRLHLVSALLLTGGLPIDRGIDKVVPGHR